MEPMEDDNFPKATRLSKKPDISPVKLIVPNLTTGAGRLFGRSLKLLAKLEMPSVVIYILFTFPKRYVSSGWVMFFSSIWPINSILSLYFKVRRFKLKLLM